jgi:hypothetical protein
MKLHRTITRTAVAGAGVALIAGGLVAATSTTATAASASTDYTCTSAFGGLGVFPVSVNVPLLPPSAPAGMPIAENLLAYDGEVIVPATTAGMLSTYEVDGADADDFSFAIGSDFDVTAPGAYEKNAEPNEDGSVTFTGAGGNVAFSLPKAGTYDVTMPESFTFTPTKGGEPLELAPGQPFTATCTSAAPGSLGTVTLSKQASTTVAKAVKAGKKHKINVTVENEYSVPTGKVVAKIGKKSYNGSLNDAGKATIVVPASAKGKKATVTYKGDGYTASSKASAVTVK